MIAFVTRSAVSVSLNKVKMFTGLEIGFMYGINRTI